MRFAAETTEDRVRAFMHALQWRATSATAAQIGANQQAAIALRAKRAAYNEIIRDLESVLAGGNVPKRFGYRWTRRRSGVEGEDSNP